MSTDTNYSRLWYKAETTISIDCEVPYYQGLQGGGDAGEGDEEDASVKRKTTRQVITIEKMIQKEYQLLWKCVLRSRKKTKPSNDKRKKEDGDEDEEGKLTGKEREQKDAQVELDISLSWSCQPLKYATLLAQPVPIRMVK
ncbi:hypothetical protein BGZ94_008520, partial [Podila epigama]